MGGRAYRLVPGPVEAAALGWPARDPDAAQSPGAVTCPDASGRRGRTVEGKAQGREAASAGFRARSLLRRAEAAVGPARRLGDDLPAAAHRERSGGALHRQ